MSAGSRVPYLLGVPVVLGLDLLRRAVDSVQPLWPHTIIIDNTDAGLDQADWPVHVLRPSVPLSFSQSMNLLQRLARERACQATLLLHSDAAVAPWTAQRLLEVVETAFAEHPRWGVAFTNYDTFAAFNLAMADEVGPWDTTLPHYFADTDYYRRVRLAGWELIHTGLPVAHNPSSTINLDARRHQLHRVTFPLYAQYYTAKWGGPPDSETFDRPFDEAI